MKRRIALILLGLLLLGSSLYVYVKSNPPLISGTIGSASDKKVRVLEVGNQSRWSDIHIEEVKVNGGAKPAQVKMQLSNPLTGFVITDNFDGKYPSKYRFASLQSVNLRKNTDPQKQLDKVNKGTATKKDKSYAVTIIDKKPVQNTEIVYRYMGLTFTHEVTFND